MESNRDRDVVSYIVHESELARQERIIKRLIMALVFTNALWLLAWTSYDYQSDDYSTEVTVDGENGNANYIGDDNTGDISYGESDSKENLSVPDKD